MGWDKRIYNITTTGRNLHCLVDAVNFFLFFFSKCKESDTLMRMENTEAVNIGCIRLVWPQTRRLEKFTAAASAGGVNECRVFTFVRLPVAAAAAGGMKFGRRRDTHGFHSFLLFPCVLRECVCL